MVGIVGARVSFEEGHDLLAELAIRFPMAAARSYENIAKQEDRVRLKELLAANRKLATVYILKDDLKHLWDYHYPGAALRFWKEMEHAAAERVKVLQSAIRVRTLDSGDALAALAA
jgi:transposase